MLNDHDLLGAQWVNTRWNNMVNWTIMVVLFALSLGVALEILVPHVFPEA